MQAVLSMMQQRPEEEVESVANPGRYAGRWPAWGIAWVGIGGCAGASGGLRCLRRDAVRLEGSFCRGP